MKKYLCVFAFFLMAAHSGVFASESVGKVLFSSGDVHVVRADGTRQVLARKDQISNNDLLVTGNGVLQVKFNDGGFMSLQKHSEMRVENYHFEGSENGKESAIFSLLRGGLRALSGAIGHKRPGRYQLRTSVATIGIRGTAYSALLCQQDCSGAYGKNLADGLHAKTTEGTIVVENDGGVLTIPAGKAAFVPDMLTIPIYTEFNPSFAAIEPRSQVKSKPRALAGSQPVEGSKLDSPKSSKNAPVELNAQQGSGKSEILKARAFTSTTKALTKVDIVNFDRFVTRANAPVSVDINANSAVITQTANHVELLKPTSTALENVKITGSSAAPTIKSSPNISPAISQPITGSVTRVQAFSTETFQSINIAPSVAESLTEVLSNTNGLSLESDINQLNINGPLINNNNYSIPGNLSNNPLHP